MIANSGSERCTLDGLILAAFSTRPLTDEEVGLYNPVYMLLETGRMTYPAHGAYDGMYVHPPVHYLVIAALQWLGVDLIHAAGIPPTLLLMLHCMNLLTSKFSTGEKVAFALVPVAVLAMWVSFQTVRPELHLTIAVLTGFFLLEAGRIADWQRTRLVLGASLVAIGSAMHYFAMPAVLGVGVYVIAASWRVTRPVAARRVGWLVAGPVVVYIALLIFFVLPLWPQIKQITAWGLGRSSGVSHAIGVTHRSYAEFASYCSIIENLNPFTCNLLALAIIKPLLLSLVPAWFIALVGFVANPRTRVLAFAIQPFCLATYLLNAHKMGNLGYFALELTFAATAGVALLVYAAGMIQNPTFLRSVGVAALVGSSMILVAPVARSPADAIRFTNKDMEISRAAGLSILGPNAGVGVSAISWWYSPGATHLYYIWPDVFYPTDMSTFDYGFFDNFDAVVLENRSGGLAYNKQGITLSSMTKEGKLQVKGFYIGRRARSGQRPYGILSYLLLQRQPAETIKGFIWDGRVARRFVSGVGDAVYRLMACAIDGAPTASGSRAVEHAASLPLKRTDGREQGLYSLLSTSWNDPVPGSCSLVTEHRGIVEEVRPDDLLALLRERDSVIQFHPTLADYLKAVKR
jgi:hypothetical protein